ncbi:TPA: molecular chaperone [Citrobacter koseri]|uniref:fimbrial biogenesis chaperone n=1 Tax=Citrobacter koseri TaxID=545 RepID=UPI001A2A5229|nr:molecular chaperone [Citrobacter koseri]HDQ2604861.1 molecular chaperone [Citrobacter koseri]
MSKMIKLFCLFMTSIFSTFSFAASLQVTPVSLSFVLHENAKAVYLSNSGSFVLRAQLRLYRWEQKDGQDVMTATSDLVVSPPFTQIPAGKTQLVRMLMVQPVPENTEQSWRLIVDELPPERSAVPASDNEINFLLRYSVPVFAGNDKKPSTDRIRISLKDNRLWVKNDNPVHIKLSNVRLFKGKQVMDITSGLMGYVLAGKEMSWSVGAGSPGMQKVEFSLNDNPVTEILPLQLP